MFAEELPESERLACGSQINEIAAALRKALEGSLSAGYGHMVPILGMPFSGRVLSSQPFMDTVGLPKILLPTEMAAELVNHLKWNARYHPVEHPNDVKGWEIRRAMTDDGPIVIAWAMWVPAYVPVMAWME
jgi:hypothetical protein